ncbi:hypothetical protein G3N55_04385 [Dissulfurirhabdus thermomarina]|uniref:ATP synthase subunit I n=1 Tax=Dissulfurirhabdus thermomarina TaxID=1765737 RepID=A0A6N9TLI3_DISTH|nr:ATP synthase subunit I [Dissulfurirhabdus thermomarina]NDY42085.1 hypothetical protein [Dissulfurirhabdus thermomarina]NMX22835.1 hypothetical protein [Dissulfurirhabdus thermomarina]
MEAIRQMISGELTGSRFVRLFTGMSWALLAVLVVGALGLFGGRFAGGVLVGGVLANLNGLGLERDCRRVVRLGSPAAYFGGMAVRLGLLALALSVALLLPGRPLSPIGIIVGLSVMVGTFYLLTLGMLAYRLFGAKEAA